MPDGRRISRHEKKNLYDLIKRVNLADFIESETGGKMTEGGGSWTMVCPMPGHNDHNPSFHIYTSGGQWFYRCYGCDSRGTIVDFCMDFKGFEHPSEALLYIMRKCGIRNNAELVERAVQEAKVDVDRKRKMEAVHFVASNNCRRILRAMPGNTVAERWVAITYMEMNNLFDTDDLARMQAIADEAASILEGEQEGVPSWRSLTSSPSTI